MQTARPVYVVILQVQHAQLGIGPIEPVALPIPLQQDEFRRPVEPVGRATWIGLECLQEVAPLLDCLVIHGRGPLHLSVLGDGFEVMPLHVEGADR